MYRERKEDISVFYWLKDKFLDTPYVNIVDEFPTTLLSLPTISVDTDMIETSSFEMGNRIRQKIRFYSFDIFANNKTQRNEFAYRLLNELENPIPVYDYDEGFPPDVSPTQLGCLVPDEIRVEILPVFPELVDKLYYRATVTLTASLDKL